MAPLLRRSGLIPLQLLQASISFFLLLLTVTLHFNILLFSCFLLALLLNFYFFFARSRRRPVLLLDYSCYLPDHDRKCPSEACEYFMRRSNRFSPNSQNFMLGIYRSSGLGEETYAPPFLFQEAHDCQPNLCSAIQEAEEGVVASVDSLLSKTAIPVSLLDTVVVTCGMSASSPSLASLVVNRYRLPDDVKTYNLSGMGCSSGALAIDLASRILNGSTRTRYVLVVITESISLSWYTGQDRSMLVANCLFRVGTAAAILTNDPSCRRRHGRRRAKLELVRSLRTHHGSDDSAYAAAYQAEDEEGNVGLALKKDLVRVAGESLGTHIRILAPRVLPLSQLVRHAYRVALSTRPDKPPHVPDFASAFEHVCVHSGGKAVIESVSRTMRLGPEATEPARMCLHRFGNTSSSFVFYELAYFDAKGRIREGDRVWMLAFGTGFKVCSLFWTALSDSGLDHDNPWKGCIHRYPLKVW